MDHNYSRAAAESVRITDAPVSRVSAEGANLLSQKTEIEKPRGVNTADSHIPSVSIAAADGQQISKEHKVKSGDSLWKISATHLKAHNEHASGKDVQSMVDQIIKANKDRYPHLAKNPHRINTSMSLIIPEFTKGTPSDSSQDKKVDPRKPVDKTKPSKEDASKKPEDTKKTEPGDKPSDKTSPDPKKDAPKKPNEEHKSDEKKLDPKSQEYKKQSDSRSAKASWYYEGKKTANGEKFLPDGLTVAHKTLPFGTILEVTNPSNGRQTTVRVNDRGPFIKGRELDLSRGAARQLGMIEKGVAMVNYRIVGKRA